MKTNTPKKTAAKTTYIARWNGAEVGRINSATKRYTHALIGQLREETARKWAYATADDDPEYRDLYDHYVKVSTDSLPDQSEYDRRYKRHTNAMVEGGFDAFVERWHSERIKWFDEISTNDDWQPFAARAIRWFQPGDLSKQWRAGEALRVFHRSSEYIGSIHESMVWDWDWTKVVPVETEISISVAQRFAKLSKKSQRELLGLVCDKMIEQCAWDEISVLLNAHLEGDAPLVLKLLGG